MIEIKNLSKTFAGRSDPNEDVEALKNVNLSIPDGSIYGIIGMSGAGKSTLVRCINMLERPTEGTVIIDGVDMAALSNKDLRAKRKEVTMIFQSFNLLMQRTCLKNICFPLELIGVKKADAERRAMELLEIVGLPDKANAYPAQLSGGQQQRIAIARALATNPKVLLCDEATSALDPKTTHQILELIKEINRNLGITCIVITHQMSVIEEICGRVAILEKGVVVEEGEVADVFAHPKSTAARHLVYPDGGNSEILALREGEQRIRVVFNGAVATERPLIAQLAKELGIEASILGANTKSIGERAYGNMILGIMGSRDDMLRAKEYLESVADVVVEEVTE
ncbi:MAG: ATP-binding cassette domain-containing protein [Clostridia bacterium]|nr:ATP-binding cassette domain-containing protein [Candidatus Limimonas egerieequi]MCQ2489409.1 ATP-binding cassette domain-containing protein [Clostridia bacterium]